MEPDEFGFGGHHFRGPPAWKEDALLSEEVMAWLDEVIATLEDPLEMGVDLQDLWEDMSAQEYEQLLETVLNEGV